MDYVGALIADVSLLYALWIVATTLILGLDVPGYASLITAVLFMGVVPRNVEKGGAALLTLSR